MAPWHLEQVGSGPRNRPGRCSIWALSSVPIASSGGVWSCETVGHLRLTASPNDQGGAKSPERCDTGRRAPCSTFRLGNLDFRNASCFCHPISAAKASLSACSRRLYPSIVSSRLRPSSRPPSPATPRGPSLLAASNRLRDCGSFSDTTTKTGSIKLEYAATAETQKQPHVLIPSRLVIPPAFMSCQLSRWSKTFHTRSPWPAIFTSCHAAGSADPVGGGRD